VKKALDEAAERGALLRAIRDLTRELRRQARRMRELHDPDDDDEWEEY
jgi:hypothetical protein